MSRSTCSNSNPRVSTLPAARAQNMNASSASGLCPSRMCMSEARPYQWSFEPVAVRPARRSGAAEERLLEPRHDLLARERRDARGELPVRLEHDDVVLERRVRLLERVVELVRLAEEARRRAARRSRGAGGSRLGRRPRCRRPSARSRARPAPARRPRRTRRAPARRTARAATSASRGEDTIAPSVSARLVLPESLLLPVHDARAPRSVAPPM